MPKWDYSKLVGRMEELGFGKDGLASACSMDYYHLLRTLERGGQFDQASIRNICRVLSIPADEISLYFFTPEGEA